MEYLGESLSKAASQAVSDLAQDNAQGGVIAVDDAGNGAHSQVFSGTNIR
jgi:beta-aspartyl-peptidase (threonine type)